MSASTETGRPNKGGTAVSRRAHRSRLSWLSRLRGLGEFVPEAAFIVISLLLWLRTGTFRAAAPGDLGPDFWPRLLIILVGVCAFVRVAQKILSRRSQPGMVPTVTTPAAAPVREASTNQPVTSHGTDPELAEAGAERAEALSGGIAEEEYETDQRKLLIGIGLAVGYVLGAIYFGYFLATAVFVFSFLYLAGRRNLLINAAVGVGAAVVFSYVFLKLVYISVPSGVGVFDAFTVWVYRLIGIY